MLLAAAVTPFFKEYLTYEYDDEMRVSSVQESESDIVSYIYDANEKS